MHELAFGVTGYNPAFHSGANIGVRNAYDQHRIAGGSSSGNGAALGARMVAAALGTDTGGSVRIPCAFNGCTALRPSVGRYPQQGIAPISHTRDTAGPMALSVADLVLLDRAITGGGAVKPVPLKRVRLGMAAPFFAHQDADTRAATDAALARLRASCWRFCSTCAACCACTTRCCATSCCCCTCTCATLLARLCCACIWRAASCVHTITPQAFTRMMLLKFFSSTSMNGTGLLKPALLNITSSLPKLSTVFLIAAGTTAVLSLDATVVLLTPVVLTTTRTLDVPPRPHGYAAAHLANTASLLLPRS